MSQSLSKLYIHGIFHTKYNIPIIRKSDKHKLYAYMGTIIKDNDCIPIIINGVEDHVHILFIMSKNITLASFMEQVKKHSSRWIKTLDPHYKDFAWQRGYAGFSVSESVYKRTKLYIENQEEHHKKTSTKNEYINYLKEYGIEYDENYLWID